MMRDMEAYTSDLDFDANDTTLLLPPQASPGRSSPGGRTAGITVSPCTCARANTDACTGGTASNCHGNQSLRHAARS